ncbi:MAG: class I SAM-dependent methyltransferase [bacterium]
MTRPLRAALLPLLLAAGCGGAPEPAPTPAPESQPMKHHHASHPGHHGAGHHGGHHGGHHPEHGQHGGAHHHGFEDAQGFAARWDTPERDAWQKPDAVVAALALDPAAHVADIGAGTGYFAVRLARAVPQGTVYAADLEPAMVAHLTERAKTEGLTNIVALQAEPDDAKLPAPVDLIMLTNTYHHIEGRTAYFTRLRDHLRPGGRLAIVDYKLQFEGHGPPPEMRLAPDTVIDELRAAGYTLASRDEATLERQYILIFEATK